MTILRDRDRPIKSLTTELSLLFSYAGFFNAGASYKAPKEAIRLLRVFSSRAAVDKLQGGCAIELCDDSAGPALFVTHR